MPAPSDAVSGPRVALALAAVYLIWGSTYLGIRFALEGGIPPFLLGSTRFLVAGGVLYAWLRWHGHAAPTRVQWRHLAVMGLLLLALGNGMVNVAEQSVSSGIAAVAVASAPIWMGVFARLRGEHPTRAEWVGIGIGFCGVLWLNADALRAGAGWGMLALLVAAVAWSFGSIWSRGRDLPSPFMTAAGQMLCGGAIMVVLALLTGERVSAVPTAKALAAWGYLVVFGSLIAFSAYIWLLRQVRPVLAGSYAYVNPVIAVLLGAWLAQERTTATELGAMAVILAGVAVITLARRARGVPSPPPVRHTR